MSCDHANETHAKRDWTHSELRKLAVSFMDGCDVSELEALADVATQRAIVIRAKADLELASGRLASSMAILTDPEPF